MNTNSSEDRAVFAAASKKIRHSEVLVRRARFAAATSRFFLLLAGLGLAAVLISTLSPKQDAPSLEYAPSTEEARARAQEVEALRESGRNMGLVILSFSSIVCVVLALRFARKWARAASESIASSEGENRRVLQVTRSSTIPFALYLRGFAEEGRSIQTLVAMPLSTKRVDKATRWIESEIVDELERRGRRVFCITNPSDRFLLPGAFRLEADPEDWLSEVSALATESEIVVFYLSGISQGVLTELDLLREQNLMNKSVIILGRKISRQETYPAGDFPIAIVAPSLSRLNQSAFGPIVGRSRFRSELSVGIEKAINS